MSLGPREVIRHPLALRDLAVVEINDVTPRMRRVTFACSDASSIPDRGPDPHIKLFFPDPDSGELNPPKLAADGGIQRPTGGPVSISRDYTPLDHGDDWLRIDFVLHEGGLASAWAAKASRGDRLVAGGPRGEKLPPRDARQFHLIADETALPAMRRWYQRLGSDSAITGIVMGLHEDVERYLDPEVLAGRDVEYLYPWDGPGALAESVRSLALNPDTFVWAAGEASTLIPIRRYLRAHPDLEKTNYSVSGYWRAGQTNFDHHAPLDPSDPD